MSHDAQRRHGVCLHHAQAKTAFRASANSRLAQGGFVDVEAGVQQFEFSGNIGECFHAGWFWASDTPKRIRIPVRAGYPGYWGPVM